MYPPIQDFACSRERPGASHEVRPSIGTCAGLTPLDPLDDVSVGALPSARIKFSQSSKTKGTRARTRDRTDLVYRCRTLEPLF